MKLPFLRAVWTCHGCCRISKSQKEQKLAPLPVIKTRNFVQNSAQLSDEVSQTRKTTA